MVKLNEKLEKLPSNREDKGRVLRDDELKPVTGGWGNQTPGNGMPYDDMAGGVTTYKNC
jgi:hypothetical protein